MKIKNAFLLALLVSFANFGFATKVISITDSDWENPASWTGNEVPLKPDTIIIRHYITLNRDLIIEAPTVLIIEKGATVCGDFLMDVKCGASIFNYGNLYLNTASIRNGYNYNEFYAKSLITISGCGSNSDGFYNAPPNGHIKVWPPVLCKTDGTNWTTKTTNIPVNSAEEFYVNISPNPLNSGYLTIATKGDFELKVYDTRGALLYKGLGSEQTYVDVHEYPNGFYFVSISYKNRQVFRKILIDQ